MAQIAKIFMEVLNVSVVKGFEENIVKLTLTNAHIQIQYSAKTAEHA